MSTIYPSVEVVDSAAGAGGLAHVCVFLARAFGQNVRPALHQRAYLHKCAGAGLLSCSSCARALAPVAPDQQWTAPMIARGTCDMRADVERFGGLYVQREVG